MPEHTLHARVRPVPDLSEAVPLDLSYRDGGGQELGLGRLVVPRRVFAFLAGEEPIQRRVYNLTLVPSANPDPK